MNISKTWKVIIGAATALVAALPAMSVFFFVRWLLVAFRSGASVEPNLTLLPEFFTFFPVSMLIGCLQLALTIFYVLHAIKTRTNSDTVRLLLGLGTCFLPSIAMPAYFVVFIWLEVVPDWERRAKPTQERRP